MIGGISIFLPFAPGGGRKFCRTCSNNRAVTVGDDCQEEELEQASGTAQVDEEKNECSEEQLNNFSQKLKTMQ
jgi:hypothetical protein